MWRWRGGWRDGRWILLPLLLLPPAPDGRRLRMLCHVPAGIVKKPLVGLARFYAVLPAHVDERHLEARGGAADACSEHTHCKLAGSSPPSHPAPARRASGRSNQRRSIWSPRGRRVREAPHEQDRIALLLVYEEQEWSIQGDPTRQCVAYPSRILRTGSLPAHA